MTSSVTFSTLAEVQRRMTSFDQYRSPEDWIEAVGESLAPIMRTDGIYFVGPQLDVRAPESSTGIEVLAPSLGEDFVAGIKSDFVGFAPTGHSVFSESYSTMLHRLVHEAGPAVVHDAPLFDEASRRELRLQTEVFDRVDIVRQLALCVPELRGEALLIFGYELQSVPEPGSDAQVALELLLPAYREALHLRRWQADFGSLVSSFDALPVPIVLVTERSIWDNHVFRRLEVTSDELDEIRGTCVNLAQSLLRAARKPTKNPLHGVTYTVSRMVGPAEFRVSARLVEHGTEPMVIAQIDRTQAVPPYSVVHARFALTPSEHAVSELLVRRLSDKEIAARLNVSYHTARQHVASVLKKTGSSRDRLAATLWCAIPQLEG
ncbi:MAG: helix-turn-helix transcriptional regulator [Myxococcota bacterium]